MKVLSNCNVLYIFRRALNQIDYRLADHGMRVAYLVLKMLRLQEKYSPEQIAEISVMALWHDIGAFKTEEIRSMTGVSELVEFESRNVIPHSVYGYLFFKELLDKEGFADAILYHHVPFEKLLQSQCRHQNLASMFFVADRYDLMLSVQKKVSVKNSFALYKDTVFSGEAVETLQELERREDLAGHLQYGEAIEELFRAFDEMNFPSSRLRDFLWLLIYAIDFRSPVTVTHTINTVSISMELAKAFGLEGEAAESLYMGSMLHDAGKISTPVEILEKPGRLTDEEFKIMREHVITTRKILEGCVTQEIVDIAVRHHERLDGTGYPLGLLGESLNLPQRILAVADVTSALLGKRSYKDPMPPEQVQSILKSNADSGKLCPRVVGMLLEHYDEILRCAGEIAAGSLHTYERIYAVYPQYEQKLKLLFV